jgi:plastocyanin domain-containing protein
MSDLLVGYRHSYQLLYNYSHNIIIEVDFRCRFAFRCVNIQDNFQWLKVKEWERLKFSTLGGHSV